MAAVMNLLEPDGNMAKIKSSTWMSRCCKYMPKEQCSEDMKEARAMKASSEETTEPRYVNFNFKQIF